LGAGTRERLAGAAQLVSAMRYTLPRDAAPTAESVDLVLRHADALLRSAAAGGPPDAALAAGSLLDETFGSEEALAGAEKLSPGARRRVEDLRRRCAEAAAKR